MAKRLSRRPLRRIIKLQVELGPYSVEGIDRVASKGRVAQIVTLIMLL